MNDSSFASYGTKKKIQARFAPELPTICLDGSTITKTFHPRQLKNVVLIFFRFLLKKHVQSFFFINSG